jgi:hypothetical protein
MNLSPLDYACNQQRESWASTLELSTYGGSSVPSGTAAGRAGFAPCSLGAILERLAATGLTQVEERHEVVAVARHALSTGRIPR